MRAHERSRTSCQEGGRYNLQPDLNLPRREAQGRTEADRARPAGQEQQTAPERLLDHLVTEGWGRSAFGLDLDADHQAEPAHLAHLRMVRRERLQSLGGLPPPAHGVL